GYRAVAHAFDVKGPSPSPQNVFLVPALDPPVADAIRAVFAAGKNAEPPVFEPLAPVLTKLDAKMVVLLYVRSQPYRVEATIWDGSKSQAIDAPGDRLDDVLAEIEHKLGREPRPVA